MYILQIENLHKSYDKFEAIKGIDLNIKKGDNYGSRTSQTLSNMWNPNSIK